MTKIFNGRLALSRFYVISDDCVVERIITARTCWRSSFLSQKRSKTSGQRKSKSEDCANVLHSSQVLAFVSWDLKIYYYGLSPCQCWSYREGRKGKGSEASELLTLNLLYNMLTEFVSVFVSPWITLSKFRRILIRKYLQYTICMWKIF